MVLSVLVIPLAGGCGSGGEDKAMCDEGTHEEDGTCLPDEASGADTDHNGEGGFAWCAAVGHSIDGAATLLSCLAPVDVAASETVTDGSYTLLPGPIRRLVP